MADNYDLFAGLGGLAGSLAGGLGTYLSNREARKAEDRAWNRETAYNHPAEQMKRFKEAGLNPNLLYGNQLAQSSGNTHASIAQREPYKLSNPLQNQLILQKMRGENKVLDLTGKNLEAMTAEANARTRALLHEYGLIEGTSLSKTSPTYQRVGANFLNKHFSSNHLKDFVETSKKIKDNIRNILNSKFGGNK